MSADKQFELSNSHSFYFCSKEEADFFNGSVSYNHNSYPGEKGELEIEFSSSLGSGIITSLADMRSLADIAEYNADYGKSIGLALSVNFEHFKLGPADACSLNLTAKLTPSRDELVEILKKLDGFKLS